MAVKETHTITMSKAELEELIAGFLSLYDKSINEKIDKGINRAIHQNAKYIWCGRCNLKINVNDTPSVHGSKNGWPSNSYHMECWKKLEVEEYVK